MPLGTNGTFAYKALLERAAYTCADCGLVDEICVCEDGPCYYVVERVETVEQDRRMVMLGWAIVGAICFAMGYVLGRVI